MMRLRSIGTKDARCPKAMNHRPIDQQVNGRPPRSRSVVFSHAGSSHTRESFGLEEQRLSKRHNSAFA
eukprot:3924512-Amphidinium_carterae.1